MTPPTTPTEWDPKELGEKNKLRLLASASARIGKDIDAARSKIYDASQSSTREGTFLFQLSTPEGPFGISGTPNANGELENIQTMEL